jgi:hypothetical protein
MRFSDRKHENHFLKQLQESSLICAVRFRSLQSSVVRPCSQQAHGGQGRHVGTLTQDAVCRVDEENGLGTSGRGR